MSNSALTWTEKGIDNYRDILNTMIRIVEFTDANGNIVPKKKKNHYKLGLNSLDECIVNFAPYKIANSGTITVRKKFTPDTAEETFQTYKVVNHVPENDDEVYVNREMNTMQFLKSQGQKKYEIVCTFYAEKMIGLFAGGLISVIDSKGNPIEMYDDFLRKGRESIDKINTITDASVLADTLKGQIRVLADSNYIIENKEDDLKDLANNITNQLETAPGVITNLDAAINRATDIESRVRLGDNGIWYIEKDDFDYISETGKYEYELEHNLASSGIIWELKNTDDNKPSLAYIEEVNNNKVIIRTRVPMDITCIANRGYYGGLG